MWKRDLQHKIVLDMIEKSLVWSWATSWGILGDGSAEVVTQLRLEDECPGSVGEGHGI